MDRRKFFKIIGTGSGGLVTSACGDRVREVLPLLVPEQEIAVGEDDWKPSICRECSAGCGTMVRVMEAERTIEQSGQKFRQLIAAIKKIEGNPLDPVSGGRLCARGQAAIQTLYHPDRLRGAHKRIGERGAGQFAPVDWGEALNEAARLFNACVAGDPSRIVFLTKPNAGTRASTIGAFLRAVGAPPPATIGVSDFTVEREAAARSFGWDGLPLYEIQEADYVLSIGADFLGGWVSPVLYSRHYGHFRQGRPGRRGRLTHAESRFSLTAGSADRWLPVKPGGEQGLALAIGHVLVRDGLIRNSDKSTMGLRESFATVDFKTAALCSGVAPELLQEIARELAKSEAPLVLAGASIVRTNSVEAVAAANAINWLLGNVGRPGGVMPPAAELAGNYSSSRPRYRKLAESLERAEMVVLDGVNPVYAVPETEALLAKAPAVISFAGLVDDSSAYADLILPDHSALESSELVVPPVAPGPALTGGRSFVRPLYETRAIDEMLAAVSAQMGRKFAIDSPRRVFTTLYPRLDPNGKWGNAEEAAAYYENQGGWWPGPSKSAASKPPAAVPALREPEFHGDAAKFPLHFDPYPSVQFGDGSNSHLPWMQELPDPASSAMWGLPVEIDQETARQLGVRNGDLVRVVSPRGSIEAPAYVNPAAIPGVAAMAIGQGHRHGGRYASGRGVNPLRVAVGAWERDTGVFAFGATRVRLERVGRPGNLVQFAMIDREPVIRRR